MCIRDSLYSSLNNFTARATQYKKVSHYCNRNSNLYCSIYLRRSAVPTNENLYGIKRFSELRTLKGAAVDTIRQPSVSTNGGKQRTFAAISAYLNPLYRIDRNRYHRKGAMSVSLWKLETYFLAIFLDVAPYVIFFSSKRVSFFFFSQKFEISAQTFHGVEKMQVEKNKECVADVNRTLLDLIPLSRFPRVFPAFSFAEMRPCPIHRSSEFETFTIVRVAKGLAQVARHPRLHSKWNRSTFSRYPTEDRGKMTIFHRWTMSQRKSVFEQKGYVSKRFWY